MKFNIKAKVQSFVLSIRKPFSPALRQLQIDTVTNLVTGKNVLELAEEALDIAGDKLLKAEYDLGDKEEALEKAVVAHQQATVTKDLRKKDFDTVVDVLK